MQAKLVFKIEFFPCCFPQAFVQLLCAFKGHAWSYLMSVFNLHVSFSSLAFNFTQKLSSFPNSLRESKVSQLHFQTHLNMFSGLEMFFKLFSRSKSTIAMIQTTAVDIRQVRLRTMSVFLKFIFKKNCLENDIFVSNFISKTIKYALTKLCLKDHYIKTVGTRNKTPQ